MDRKGLGVSARRGMMTTPRIHSFFPKLSLASVHKYLRIRDLCKELAFGSQHAGGECRSSYNSFEFNVLCRQFLESSSPASGLSASSCSYGRSFALRFFRLQISRSVACTSATVTSTSSDDLLSYH